MPIEIRELHIKVTVNAPQSGTQPSPTATASLASGSSPADKDAIVAECVEQVMQIIKEKNER